MSDWLFDLGNSRLKAVARSGGDASAAGSVLAIDHDGVQFDAAGMAALPGSIDTAFVASVAAMPVRVALLDALSRRCRRICLATTPARFEGLQVAYPEPAQMGVDRFLALVGARCIATHAWLVVGVGTALTIDLVDGDGLHRGGRIAPSPQLSRLALHGRASQLPLHGGEPRDFAANTRDALASGCEGAAVALVRASLDAGHALLGSRPALLLHGGGAATLRIGGARLEPALVLQGLARWACAELPAASHCLPQPHAAA